MKNKILEKLRSADGFVSGQSLCDEYGVSRTAVWKAINQLKKEGYEIESVNNKGYRIVATPNVLSEKEIRACLDTRWLGKNITCYDVIGSTNTEIASMAESGAIEGTLAVADRQDTGKGRRGRAWTTPSGVAVAMSFLLRPDIAVANAPRITLVAAMAVAAAVEQIQGELLESDEQQGLQAARNKCAGAADINDQKISSIKPEVRIKWPNDIVINGKKICGILTEMSCQMDYINHVVVGIGINVNNDEFPDEIKETAISLKQCFEKEVNRAKLTAYVCNHFEKYYDIFLKTQDLSGLVDEYNSKLANLGAGVRVLDMNGEFDGISKGINPGGELMVIKNDTKEEILVSSGEVSVRGIYGYV